MKNTAAAQHDAADTLWNIAEIIELRAQHTPAAAALILPEGVATYGELVVAVHAIARKLLDSGVRAGQTLGVSMMQTPLHLLTLLAIARIGAVSVPVHGLLPEQRRRLIVQRFGACAIVSGRPDLRLEGVPFIDLSNVNLAGPVPAVPASGSVPEAPFRIALSSGTTGEPKGVLYTHGYMLERTRKTIATCALQPRSRLMPMDFNFSVGFVYAIGALLEGCAVVFTRMDTSVEIANAVRAQAVTHWLLSPSIAEEIALLLNHEAAHFPALPHLRLVGATPGRRLLNTLFARFSPNVFEHYGATEMGPIAIATPEILRQAPTSAGRLLPSITAEVGDDEQQVGPAGRTGRLRLKEPGMIDRYYRNPELTAARFRDGWYYPGDLVCIDASGLLYIQGRQDDVINVGGRKIAFRDVEDVLRTHPAVREAAAFVLDEHAGGTTLVAAFVTSAPVSEAELQTWAVSALGPDCPEHLFHVGGLPRNLAGKLLRDQLASLIAPTLPQTPG